MVKVVEDGNTCSAGRVGKAEIVGSVERVGRRGEELVSLLVGKSLLGRMLGVNCVRFGCIATLSLRIHIKTFEISTSSSLFAPL